MEPQGRESDAPVRTRRRSGTLGLRKTTLESRVHVQTVGLNAKKIISALSQGKTFLLTFPFIGSLRKARCLAGRTHERALTPTRDLAQQRQPAASASDQR